MKDLEEVKGAADDDNGYEYYDEEDDMKPGDSKDGVTAQTNQAQLQPSSDMGQSINNSPDASDLAEIDRKEK